MEKKVTIRFRCDGNSTIGMGHVVRCVSLALTLKDDFDIFFYTKGTPEHAINSVLPPFFGCTDIPSETFFLETIQPEDIVVLDGYGFDTEYQQAIKAKGCKLVCIDDLANGHFVADIIINHTPGTTSLLYQDKTAPHTLLCLGLKYALLRKTFLHTQARTTPPEKLQRGLICLGGADPQNHTLYLLKQAVPATMEHMDIVIGPAFMHRPALESFTRHDPKYVIYSNIGEDKMVELIQKNDFAVVSASTISLECVFVGIPLYIFLTADNQTHNYDYLLKKEAALPVASIIGYNNKKGKDMLYVQQEISGDRKATDFSKIFKSII